MSLDTSTGDATITFTRSAFVLIRSWHLQSGLVSRGGMLHTLCGRWAPSMSQTAPGLPAGKSCETCFRLREQAGE